jgi:tRNA nucleotidyltransferase/poly(A) polymerase
MRLELSRLREAGASDDKALMAAAAMGRLLDFALVWQRPKFPVKGRNLIAQGMKPGKEMGRCLKALEERWVESGFTLGKKALLESEN